MQAVIGRLCTKMRDIPPHLNSVVYPNVFQSAPVSSFAVSGARGHQVQFDQDRPGLFPMPRYTDQVLFAADKEGVETAG